MVDKKRVYILAIPDIAMEDFAPLVEAFKKATREAHIDANFILIPRTMHSIPLSKLKSLVNRWK